jgi:SAM-dependent MidA family methyltransferase
MALIRFDAFMEEALYGLHGFYAVGRGAGTSRDFLTSPEVGSLFGAVIARRLDEEWQRLGQPEEFRVVEMGAGPGTLCRTIFAAQPACLEALRYDLVDRAEGMRALHAAHLPEHQVRSHHEFPTDVTAHVILGNEILDNIPFRILHFVDAWNEVHIRFEGNQSIEELVPIDPVLEEQLQRLVPSPTAGCRVPYQQQAAELVGKLLKMCPVGLFILIDYARATTSEFATLPPSDWLRTYDRHRRGSLGEKGTIWAAGATDITVDVAIDQMQNAVQRQPIVRSQRAALHEWGLEKVLVDSSRQWGERPNDFHLPSLRFRSHASEVPILCDPLGLGGFTVLEWPALNDPYA